MQINLTLDTATLAPELDGMAVDELDEYYRQNEDGCKAQMIEAALSSLVEQAAL